LKLLPAGRRIVLDVDNVLADTAGSFCKLAQEEIGTAITKDMIRSPKIVGSLRADPRVIFEVLNHVWDNWEDLQLLETDVPSTIRRLQSNGNIIIVATSRPIRSRNQVLQWLKKNGVPYNYFEHLGPHTSKSVLDADILVDDDTDQATEFALTSDHPRQGVIYDQPWNRSILFIERVSRISKLSELVRAHV
jgi:5'(3')-deoxyribonucleotidase